MTLAGQLLHAGMDLDTGIIVRKVRIPSANVKLLRASPYELVPAPGSRRWLEFVSAMFYLDVSGAVLAETTDNLAIKYTNGSGVAVSETIETTGFLDQSVDTIIYAVPLINAVVAASGALNKSLVLHNTGNGEFTGNSGNGTVLDVRISYKVHKIHVAA